MSGMVDHAVGRLDRRLRGPRRVRRDMVAEIRDGLHDAAAAYEDAGLERAEAARRALDDFGDLDAVARELQHELAARQARRAALFVALAFLPLVLAWDLVWRFVPPDGPPAAGDLDLVFVAMDVVQLVAALVAAGLAVALGRADVGPRLCRAAGMVGVATPATVMALFLAGLAAGPRTLGAALLTPATTVLSLASAAVLAASLRTGARCLRLSPGRAAPRRRS